MPAPHCETIFQVIELGTGTMVKLRKTVFGKYCTQHALHDPYYQIPSDDQISNVNHGHPPLTQPWVDQVHSTFLPPITNTLLLDLPISVIVTSQLS